MSAVSAPIGDDPITTWLDQLYGTAEAGWLTLFSLDHTTGARSTDWAPVDDPSALVAAAHRRAPDRSVWFGVATRRERLGGGRRGEASDCLAIPGLWADIDITGIGHHGPGRLARDLDHALDVVAAFPIPPTVIVHTGGGIQPWWLFAEMVDIDDDTRHLLAAWATTWARIGAEGDLDPDNVFDPARVMRLPGTVNRKEGGARPVEIHEADWSRRYGLDDIDQHLDTPPTTQAPARVPYIGPERPGDAFNARHTGAEILTRAGFTLGRTDNSTGDTHWVRPGKDAREGTSATVYAVDGHTTIWSDTVTHQWPQVATGRPYDAFGLYATLEHRGDYQAATKTLRDLGYGAERRDFIEVSATELGPADPTAVEIDDDWQPVDLAAVLSGDLSPPTPTILTPEDATSLLYEGRVNSIFGESGAGKTWVELAAIVETLDAGRTAMLIDLEDTAHGIVNRLVALGVDTAAIAERFVYLSPQTAWGIGAQLALGRLLEARDVALVCIDSTGEAMAAGGVKGNDDDDVARWFTRFPKWIARQGPAVLIVDHVPKDPNAPTTYAIGSQRKMAAIDGASYRVDSIRVPSRTANGELKLTTAKDRHGHHQKGFEAARVSITHTGHGAVSVTVSGPSRAALESDEEWLPTYLMEQVSRLLEDRPGLSKRGVREAVRGKAKHVDIAIGELIRGGFVDLDPGAKRGFAYVSVEPYRESTGVATVSESQSLPSDRTKDIVLHGPTVSRHDRDTRVHRVPSPTGTRTRPEPQDTVDRVPPNPPVDNSRPSEPDIDPDLAWILDAGDDR